MQKNSKSIIEQCHTEKFIASYNNEIKILMKSEAPDFILGLNNERIGLEVERVYIKSPENRGFIENIFKKAEVRLREKDPSIKNILNFVVDESVFPFENKMKETTITQIFEYAYNVIMNNNIPSPNFIKRFSISIHSDIKLIPNLGAYWVGQLNIETITASIKKKERLLANYKSNTKLKTQWLLLVVNGVNEDSDYSNFGENTCSIESQFEKVFLLNDFKAEIFQLK